MGLGLSGGGVGVAKWLLKHGAQVTVTDLKPAVVLKQSVSAVKKFAKTVSASCVFVLGEHRLKDFSEADLVIKNPGVPDTSEYLIAARKAGVAIETDIG